MKKDKKQTSKTREEIREEIKELSKKADEIGYSQLSILPDLEEEEANTDLEKLNFNTADPDKSYNLYYGAEKLLREYLPKGVENKNLRAFVREEKNVFLNRGKKKNKNGLRLGDARQTYIDPFLEESLQIVINWIKTGSNPLDLYDAYKEVNIRHGFDTITS